MDKKIEYHRLVLADSKLFNELYLQILLNH
jgi:hypothetical protein